ncbi:MAG: SRPBCC family protein [Lutibacter sp.]
MHYSNKIEINASLKKVIELFDNPNNLKYWQKGFISFEHLSGKIGEKGAKSILKYKMGAREIEMIETITNRNLPDEFSGIYEAKGVWNEVKNYFSEEKGVTTWVSECEFRFSGFMKIIAFLMPNSFKKQSHQFMIDFKNFVENYK